MWRKSDIGRVFKLWCLYESFQYCPPTVLFKNGALSLLANWKTLSGWFNQICSLGVNFIAVFNYSYFTHLQFCTMNYVMENQEWVLSFNVFSWQFRRWGWVEWGWNGCKISENHMNMTMLNYQFRNFHYKDKMVSWLLCLHNEKPYATKDGLYTEGQHEYCYGDHFWTIIWHINHFIHFKLDVYTHWVFHQKLFWQCGAFTQFFLSTNWEITENGWFVLADHYLKN